MRVVETTNGIGASNEQMRKALKGAETPGWEPEPVAPTIIGVLGAPGSGRSTHCASIASMLNGTALNAESAMMAAVTVGTPIGEKVASVMSQGKAVTYELYD